MIIDKIRHTMPTPNIVLDAKKIHEKAACRFDLTFVINNTLNLRRAKVFVFHKLCVEFFAVRRMRPVSF